MLGETYRVESLLGQGGMGSVYRATHLRLGRAVAFKVIQEHLTSDPSTHDRFVREAEAVRCVSSPLC